MERKHLAAATFAACVLAANLMTANLPHILGVSAGTFAAGIALLARDWLDEVAGRRWVIGAILAGAALSAAMTPGYRLAVASFVAFGLSEAADWFVYRPLRRRGWARAAITSNIVGAVLDSILFLAIAGFPLWPGVPAQALAKTLVTALVVGVVVVGNAVLRNRVRPESA